MPAASIVIKHCSLHVLFVPLFHCCIFVVIYVFSRVRDPTRSTEHSLEVLWSQDQTSSADNSLNGFSHPNQSLTTGNEAVTRGVICSTAPPSSLPASVTNEQLASSMQCAVNCLHGDPANCQTNGFTMEWSPINCITDGSSGSNPLTDYSCAVSP